MLLATLLAGTWVTATMADEAVEVTVQAENHSQAIEAWREARDKRLRLPTGWLLLGRFIHRM